jgi:aminoglycoside phosphotransferase (APT) family kinase protein
MNISDADCLAARLSGAALARLHAWNPELGEWDVRDGRREAMAMQQRVLRLIAWQPAIKMQLQRLGDELAGRLQASAPDHLVVAHGGYKRSQLIPAVDRVFVIDFDGMCAADPALDVGCFLAYLRPTRMYYGRRGYREWFLAAAAHFLAAYSDATITNGGRTDTVAGVLVRARLYEAAHLFKIATRRASRLSSPRPRELSAICEEIAGCLADPRRWS